MAIVKVNYVKRGEGEKKRAKNTIRYIQNRRGRDGEKITRPLFGNDGAMERSEAYRMIEDAQKGSIFFRFIISPDPQNEDTVWDLHMREVTRATMQALREKVDKPVLWVASEHADHAPHRHVHVLAVVPKPLYKQDFEHLRDEATASCLEQRRELDLAWERQISEREEMEWARAI